MAGKSIKERVCGFASAHKKGEISHFRYYATYALIVLVVLLLAYVLVAMREEKMSDEQIRQAALEQIEPNKPVVIPPRLKQKPDMDAIELGHSPDSPFAASAEGLLSESEPSSEAANEQLAEQSALEDTAKQASSEANGEAKESEVIEVEDDETKLAKATKTVAEQEQRIKTLDGTLRMMAAEILELKDERQKYVRVIRALQEQLLSHNIAPMFSLEPKTPAGMEVSNFKQLEQLGKQMRLTNEGVLINNTLLRVGESAYGVKLQEIVGNRAKFLILKNSVVFNLTLKK